MRRRRFLAWLLGVAGGAVTVGVVGTSMAATTTPTIQSSQPLTVEPAYGAGLFDVDPAQGNLSQDPNVLVVGDVAALPEDTEF